MKVTVNDLTDFMGNNCVRSNGTVTFIHFWMEFLRWLPMDKSIGEGELIKLFNQQSQYEIITTPKGKLLVANCAIPHEQIEMVES